MQFLLVYDLNLKHLIALSIAITDTPTSAKIPSHKFAYPNTDSNITSTFIPIENIMFCLTILMVFLLIL